MIILLNVASNRDRNLPGLFMGVRCEIPKGVCPFALRVFLVSMDGDGWVFVARRRMVFEVRGRNYVILIFLFLSYFPSPTSLSARNFVILVFFLLSYFSSLSSLSSAPLSSSLLHFSFLISVSFSPCLCQFLCLCPSV